MFCYLTFCHYEERSKEVNWQRGKVQFGSGFVGFSPRLEASIALGLVQITRTRAHEGMRCSPHAGKQNKQEGGRTIIHFRGVPQ